jgi:hypothetical protein
VPTHEVNGTAFTRLDDTIVPEPADKLAAVGEMLPDTLGSAGQDSLEAHGENAKSLAKVGHDNDSFFTCASSRSNRNAQLSRMRVTHADTSSIPFGSSS